MYIDSIDSILDNTLDDFFKEIVTAKKLSNILHTVNFVEKQGDLMKILSNYINSIDLTEIKKSINDNQNTKILLDMIHKYIFYYAFVIIGYFYEDKMDIFKNNVIEFSKIYDRKQYDVQNFFTSESNSNIFILTEMSRDIYDILIDEKVKHKKTDKIYDDTTKLLEELGDEFSEELSKLISKQKDKMIQAHNIVKLVLIQKLYLKNDKNDIIKILESESISTGESIYIDIVIPLEKSVDLIDIESMLSQEDIEQGIAKNIYDIISKGEMMYQQQFLQTTESKILGLINSGYLIPISEDFMLYHKDSEKYDSSKSDNKKKDSLRIKYILDKISATENYYSNEDPKKQNTSIYTPMANRFAITVNENEDLKIINKLLKHGGKITEGNEYYGELLHYRKYPYINFKDFKKNGFPLIFNSTKTVVRSVSFDKSGETRQQPHNQVQIRIGSNEQQVNIVGFMVNTSNIPIECMRVKHLQKITNVYDDFLSSVTNGILTGKSYVAGWLFDLENDNTKINTYEQFDKLEQAEKCKIICAKLSDDIIDAIYQKIVNVLNGYEELSFYDAFKIVNLIMKVTLRIPEIDPKFTEIKKIIFHKIYEKYVPQYDKKDDIIYGLYGETLKLPNIPIIQEPPILRINLTHDEPVTTTLYDEMIGGLICQHFVTWSNILLQRKVSDAKYVDMLYEFMQTFVVENEDYDYVCKSCGSLLDIKKYVSEGTYDEATQRFIPYSIPMNISLEDLPEYRKYNIVIRNIDNLINRIAENINIPYLIGSSLTQKINRTTMVKDTVDLLLINNSLLRKNFKERNEAASRMYGINRDLSNLFAFELDNGIFLFTPGKEKDYYKYIKHNNIVAYIMFLILLELDESHIAFLSSDKVCNYNLYAKFGDMMLDGLKLRINSSGDIKNVTDYPVLCYLIYVSTCVLSKYPIWHHDTEVVKKKVSPIKQKIMIHTIIDVINCVLEYATENKNKHIYEIIHSKFNNKLRSTYSNSDFMKRLKDENIKNLPQFTKIFGKDLVKPIILTSVFEPSGFDRVEYNKYNVMKYYPKNRDLITHEIEPSNKTHCKDGTFHIWVAEGKTMKCNKCSVMLNDNSLDDNLTLVITENTKIRYLEKLCDKYCINGNAHSYEKRIVEKDGNIIQVCKACGYKLGEYLSISKMKELDAVRTYPIILTQSDEMDAKREKYEFFVGKVISSIKGQYVESKTHRDDYYKFIERFVDSLQGIIGDTIKIDDKTVHLKEDTYIIDHNHLGYPIEPQIVITEHSDSISFKKNNTFFKKDVIIYSTKGVAKIEVFYDMHTHILIGYKEFNKDYVSNIKTENRIKIEHSLVNKIKYLGNSNEYIDITKFGNANDPEIINKVISTISRERIGNIGNIIYKFLVYVNMIKNKLKTNISKDARSAAQTSESSDEEDFIVFDVEKYYRKLIGLTTKTEDIKLFKLWNLIVQNIHYHGNTSKKMVSEINKNMITLDDVYNHDYSGNLILYYFISELSKLLEMNKNKYVRQNLTQFIIEFIDVMFTEYNKDHLEYINEIQRFICMINSSDYFRELEEKGFGMDEFTSGIYGEYKDPDEVKSKEDIEAEEEAKEEAESIDVDGDIDAEDAYDASYSYRETSHYTMSKWGTTLIQMA